MDKNRLCRLPTDMTQSHSKVVVCPGIDHSRIYIRVDICESFVCDVPCTLVKFVVNDRWWNTFMHTRDYSRVVDTYELEQKIHFPQGWVSVHLDEYDVSLCTCQKDGHVQDEAVSWDIGLYMAKLQQLFLDTIDRNEEDDMFPTEAIIRETMKPLVKIVKGSRNDSFAISTDIIITSVQGMENVWKHAIQSMKPMLLDTIPWKSLAVTIYDEIATVETNANILTYQWDTSYITDVCTNVLSFLACIHDFTSESSSRQIKHYMSNPRCIRALWLGMAKHTMIDKQWVAEVGKNCFGVKLRAPTDLIRIVMGRIQRHNHRMFLMTMIWRLQRWKWRAVKNQNHPLVLYKRGVFDEPFEAQVKTCL